MNDKLENEKTQRSWLAFLSFDFDGWTKNASEKSLAIWSTCYVPDLRIWKEKHPLPFPAWVQFMLIQFIYDIFNTLNR